MSEAFDPYLHWLGIRDPQRPPNYYRLLGIELFEADPDIIAGAADRQMAHIRSFQSGPRSAESQRLLNELAMAKVCLLNPTKKEAYDSNLQAEGILSAPIGPLSGLSPTSGQASGVAGKVQPPPPPAFRAIHSPLLTSPKYPVMLLAIMVLAAMLVVLGGLVVLVVGGKRAPENATIASGPDETGSASKLPVEEPQTPEKSPPEAGTSVKSGAEPDSGLQRDSTSESPTAVQVIDSSKSMPPQSEMETPLSPQTMASRKPGVESEKVAAR